MSAPEMLQNPQEFAQLLAVVIGLKPRRVLEIGSMYGGTLYQWMRFAAPQALVVSVDLIVSQDDPRHAGVLAERARWGEYAAQFGADLRVIVGDSTAPETIRQVQAISPEYDFVFIDGCHDTPVVRADFETYSTLVRPGGVVALHDVSVADNSVHGTGRYWRSLRPTLERFTEFNERPGEFGIGVVWM